MPFKSEKQKRLLWKTNPELAREWEKKHGRKKEREKKKKKDALKKRALRKLLGKK